MNNAVSKNKNSTLAKCFSEIIKLKTTEKSWLLFRERNLQWVISVSKLSINEDKMFDPPGLCMHMCRLLVEMKVTSCKYTLDYKQVYDAFVGCAKASASWKIQRKRHYTTFGISVFP